ncbi:MAG: ATP-dependent sacrificial sulfur transferase LarE [Planctomycetota bacterium]|jgi:uncharacterized protein
MGYQDKYNRLQALLKNNRKVAVAFSGGVDSTFLLKAAVDTLGPENVIACIGISASLAQHQLAQAKEMAQLISAELIEIPLDELDDPNYQVNKADRCFHCKSCQFRTIQQYAKTRGIETTLCGTNYDDKDDYRPGNRAVIALGIGTPLMDAELTKPDIRTLSKEMGLPTAEMPASPCLASRVAYGQTITEEKLNQVEQAEDVLREMGFVEFRVRHHGNVARIEVPTAEIEKLVSKPFRTHILDKLKAIGFQYIALDLQGFRSGSLNESLTEDEKMD